MAAVHRPDYATARQEAGFTWSVAATQEALRALTATPIQAFNLDPEACIDCYRRGRPLVRELFGSEVGLPGLSTPAVSYGHANGLGCELLFPVGGEVCLHPIFASLEQGLAALAQPVDWASQGYAPFYRDFRRRLQAAFPGEAVALGFGPEGPLTTAYEVRGMGFFTDLYDQPELAVEFLERLTASIVDFCHWLAAEHDRPACDPAGGGLCDDLASFIPPPLCAQFVLPCWEQYYRGVTSGPRHLHAEDLTWPHLPYLEQAGIAYFDPSISAKLNPQLIRDHCRVPFLWRLGDFHLTRLTPADVSDIVFQAAADGAGGVFIWAGAPLCDEAGAAKVAAFTTAARTAQKMLAAGAAPADLAACVRPEARDRFWENWWW